MVRYATLGALLLLAMTASTITLPAFSVLSPFLLDDLGMSRAQLGWVVTATPAVGALLSPMAGRLTDRLGGPRVLALLFGASAGVLGLVITVPAYPLLVVAAATSGLLSAAGNPSTNRLVYDLFPRGRRGWITGVKQSGLQVGMLVAGAVLPAVAAVAGWRVAVAVLLAVPLAGMALLLGNRRHVLHASGGTAAAARGRAPLGPVRWLVLYALLMGAGSSVALSFLPLYAQESLGFSPVAGGAVASLVGAVGLVGRIAWSRVTEGVRRYWVPLATIAATGIAGIGAVRLAATGGAALLWLGAALTAASIVAWNGAGMMAVISVAREEEVGRLSGLVQMGFFLGLASSPAAFGYLVDRTGGYAVGWSVLMGVVAAGVPVAIVGACAQGRVDAHAR